MTKAKAKPKAKAVAKESDDDDEESSDSGSESESESESDDDFDSKKKTVKKGQCVSDTSPPLFLIETQAGQRLQRPNPNLNPKLNLLPK